MSFRGNEHSFVIGVTAMILSACASRPSASSEAVRRSRSAITPADVSWVAQPTLAPDSGVPDDNFGASVAIDNDVAVVGAPGHAALVPAQGAPIDGAGSAYVWRRKAGKWSFEQELTAADAAEYRGFGRTVAVSGNIAAVSAANGQNGAVYIFSLDASSTVWTQTEEFAGETGEALGLALALRGEQLLIGAPLNGAAGMNAGAVYLATRTGAEWSKRLLPFSPVAGDRLGGAVALGEGLAAAGAQGASNRSGAAYGLLLSGSGTPFTLATQETHPFASFGASLAIFGSGAQPDTIAVGAQGYINSNGDHSGAVFVFTGSGATWSVQQTLVPDEAQSGDSFGSKVGLGADFLLSTAPGANIGLGNAFLYLRDGTTWSYPAPPLQGDFGFSFAQSGAASGREVIIGSTSFDVGPGAALVFALSQGSSCTTNADCALGHCSEGVCCDQPCADACHSCLKKFTGTDDGVCKVVVAGTNPRGLCVEEPTSSCKTTGFCDASGRCALYPNHTSCGAVGCNSSNQAVSPSCDGQGSCEQNPTECGAFLCSGATCGTSCSSNQECIPAAYCDLESTPGVCNMQVAAGCTADHKALTVFDGSLSSCGNYLCRDQSAVGAPSEAACLTTCATTDDCNDGLLCSEGVCCDTACNDDCHSCLKSRKGSGVDGVCGPVALGTDPRDQCPTEKDCGKTGVCGNGQCAFQSEDVACGASTCIGNDTEQQSCDGKGVCAELHRQPCDSAVCVDGVCTGPCTSDASCPSFAFCTTDGHCAARQPPKCHGNSAVSFDGVTETLCGDYRCEDGKCRTDCDVSDDCVSSFCQARKCTAVQPLNTPSASCAFSRSSTESTEWLVTLALVSLIARRKEFSRSSLR